MQRASLACVQFVVHTVHLAPLVWAVDQVDKVAFSLIQEHEHVKRLLWCEHRRPVVIVLDHECRAAREVHLLYLHCIVLSSVQSVTVYGNASRTIGPCDRTRLVSLFTLFTSSLDNIYQLTLVLPGKRGGKKEVRRC